MAEKNGNLIKCFLWLLAILDKKSAIHNAFNVARAMYTKYPLLGIRDTKLANSSFELLISLDNGVVYAEKLLAEAENEASVKKMKAIMAKH